MFGENIDQRLEEKDAARMQVVINSYINITSVLIPALYDITQNVTLVIL